MSYDFDQQHRGMSSGTKLILGCGGVAFLSVVLLCGGVILVGWRVADNLQEVARDFIEEIEKQANAFATRFEAQGYQRVTGQVVRISSEIKQPTVYTVQSFELNADSESSIAVMAQVAAINGSIDGDLHFYGQALEIHEDAVITGNVYVEMAQVFENKGTVEGEVIRDAPPMLPADLEAGEAESTESPSLKPSPGDVIEKAMDSEGESPTNDPGLDSTAPDAPPSQTDSQPDTDEESNSRQDEPDTEATSQSSS